MKKKQVLMMWIVGFLASSLMVLNLPMSLLAQADEKVKVNSSDSLNEYLIEKLSVWEDVLGNIFQAVRFEATDSSIKDVKLGFDPSYVGDGAVWGNNSDFTWTFDGSGGTDPTLTFGDDQIDLTGKLYVSGHSAMGSGATIQDGSIMRLKESFNTTGSTKAAEFYITQTVDPEGGYPGALIGEIEYNAAPLAFNPNGTYDFDDGSKYVVGNTGFDLTELHENYLIKRVADGAAAYTAIATIDTANNRLILVENYRGTDGTNNSTNSMRRAYRVGGIQGNTVVSGSAEVEGIRGVVGGVEVTDSAIVNGAAIGTRGSINMSSDGSIETAACLATYSKIEDGEVDQWVGCGIESPVVASAATINAYVVGVAIQPLDALIANPLSTSAATFYGFWQQGNEQNLFNGYLTVDRQIESNATDLSSIEVTANIGDIEMDTYSGIRCKTPDKHVSADVNTICAIYIEDMMGLGLSNAFGIYQFGNEPNWFKGNITTSGDLNAGGDTTLNGDVDIDEDLIVTGTVDIDGTERVRAYVSSNQETSTGNTKVEFDTKNYDNLGSFASYRFTPTQEGYYQVNVTIRWDNVSTNGNYGIRIYKKTTIYSEGWLKAANDADDFFSMNISDVLPLDPAQSDYIEVYVYTNDADAEIYGASANSFISIHK
ncbi:MAG: hypothetical protein ABIG42_04635, partial [bacterium]